jgi:dTDP-glucose 4,6-dehydratase
MTKRMLVTGGAGFIAHHVIDHFLKTTDWEIVSLDRLDYSGNLNRLHNLVSQHSKENQKRVKIVWHDLKSEISELTRSFIGHVDVIMHLAASSHVDRSISNPMEFCMDNTVGTVNLLNYARTIPNLERFIYFSTDEVFGPAPNGILYKERDRYNSTNPYSASKAAGEEFCVAFENTYNLPIYITHTMNVFGERQHPEKFIPMCIRKINDGETVTIHSDPTKTIPGSRFYIHARDVAEAMHFLLHLNDAQKAIVAERDAGGAKCPKFNVVGKEEIDNLSLAKAIAEAEGKELKYDMIDFHSSRPGHDLRYGLDGNFMRDLGWEPKLTLKERIKEVVDWSLANKEWISI